MARTDTRKVSTYLTSETDELRAFAALYEFRPDPSLQEDHEDKWLVTCTILTPSATDALGHIHEGIRSHMLPRAQSPQEPAPSC